MDSDLALYDGYMKHLTTTALTIGLLTASAAADHLVIFTFDQLLDAVLRIEDRNGDGDTLDPGEVVS